MINLDPSGKRAVLTGARGRPLGVGFIGAGAAVQAIHLPALASLPTKFRVRHVVDASSLVSASVAERLGARHGVQPMDLLSDPEVDVVVIAAPDILHPRLAIDACRAGKKAVLVEKPLALTPGEADAVVRESAATGVPVIVGTMHVHDPAFQAALPFVADARAVTIETVFGPNDAAVVDAVELVRGAPDVVDAVATMMQVGAPIMLAGEQAPDAWFVASLLMLGLSTHDLAILRAAHGEPSVVHDARLLAGGGLQIVLGYDSGLTATLIAYPTQTKHNQWRARWLSPDRIVEVSFPVSYASSAGSTLEVHERDDRFARSQTWAGRNETGFRREWLHLHAVVLGQAAPKPSASEAAADVALVQKVIRKGAGTQGPSAARPRRVALTAAGWIASVHAPIVAGLGHQVGTVASRTVRSAERIAWPHGANAVTLADLVLGDSDVVIVGGPPATHAPQAVDALAAGKTVLVEKPLASTLQDADRLIEAGGQVGYLENWAFAPLMTASIEAVRRGDVGRLRQVEVRCLHGAPAWGEHLKPSWGGGCLFDLGPHPVWWAMALLGEPATAVRATLADDDTHADVELRTASGATGAVAVSWRQPPGSMVVDAVVVGERATLRANYEPRASLALDPGGPVAFRTAGPALIGGGLRKAGYIQQLGAFLGDDWNDLPSAPLGRDVLEIICAAYASDGAGGTWIALPFTGPRDQTPYQLRRSAG
ncbi:MAG TPA: Gfo/Idh/MocA family oxidoreductase [Caulobacteraceae bacterium]|nr:Gfo/Idh/MocA family oxidoreductase [Caulobacteraceae bacterium]